MELYHSFIIFPSLSKRIIKIIFALDHVTHVLSFILGLVAFWRCLLNKDLLIRLKMLTFVFILVPHLLELLARILDFGICIVLIGRFVSEMALLKSYFSVEILLLIHMFWVLKLLSVIKRFMTVVFLLLVFFHILIITHFLISLNLLFLIFFLE